MCAYGPNGRYSGIRALWIKVIIRAVFDWVAYKDSPKLMQRRLAESAYLWLFRPNVLFNGFESVCFHLGINPVTVRGWAMRITRRQVAKIELLERYRTKGDEKARRIRDHKILEAYTVS